MEAADVICQYQWGRGAHYYILHKEALSGACLKDPGTEDRIEGGGWGWVGRGEVVVGKWRQLLEQLKKFFKTLSKRIHIKKLLPF